jgi:hypothetical protein
MRNEIVLPVGSATARSSSSGSEKQQAALRVDDVDFSLTPFSELPLATAEPMKDWRDSDRDAPPLTYAEQASIRFSKVPIEDCDTIECFLRVLFFSEWGRCDKDRSKSASARSYSAYQSR